MIAHYGPRRTYVDNHGPQCQHGRNIQ